MQWTVGGQDSGVEPAIPGPAQRKVLLLSLQGQRVAGDDGISEKVGVYVYTCCTRLQSVLLATENCHTASRRADPGHVAQPLTQKLPPLQPLRPGRRPPSQHYRCLGRCRRTSWSPSPRFHRMPATARWPGSCSTWASTLFPVPRCYLSVVTGRIRAIQLDYSEAYKHLTQVPPTLCTCTDHDNRPSVRHLNTPPLASDRLPTSLP